MRSPILTAGLAAALLLASSAGAQQNSSATSVKASAAVVPALALQKSQDLVLGEFRPGAALGTVELEVARGNGTGITSRSASGGVTLAASPFSAAEFSVTGPQGASVPFTVSLPSTITLARVGGDETMDVDSFRTNVNPECVSGAGASQCPGSPYILRVGATLHVKPNQIAGRYVGSFTVTVNQL